MNEHFPGEQPNHPQEMPEEVSPMGEVTDQTLGQQSGELDGEQASAMTMSQSATFTKFSQLPSELQNLIEREIRAVTFGNPDTRIRRMALRVIADEVLSGAATIRNDQSLLGVRDAVLDADEEALDAILSNQRSDPQ